MLWSGIGGSEVGGELRKKKGEIFTIFNAALHGIAKDDMAIKKCRVSLSFKCKNHLKIAVYI